MGDSARPGTGSHAVLSKRAFDGPSIAWSEACERRAGERIGSGMGGSGVVRFAALRADGIAHIGIACDPRRVVGSVEFQAAQPTLGPAGLGQRARHRVTRVFMMCGRQSAAGNRQPMKDLRCGDRDAPRCWPHRPCPQLPAAGIHVLPG